MKSVLIGNLKGKLFCSKICNKIIKNDKSEIILNYLDNSSNKINSYKFLWYDIVDLENDNTYMFEVTDIYGTKSFELSQPFSTNNSGFIFNYSNAKRGTSRVNIGFNDLIAMSYDRNSFRKIKGITGNWIVFNDKKLKEFTNIKKQISRKDLVVSRKQLEKKEGLLKNQNQYKLNVDNKQKSLIINADKFYIPNKANDNLIEFNKYSDNINTIGFKSNDKSLSNIVVYLVK
jgi:hypothetical protein